MRRLVSHIIHPPGAIMPRSRWPRMGVRRHLLLATAVIVLSPLHAAQAKPRAPSRAACDAFAELSQVHVTFEGDAACLGPLASETTLLLRAAGIKAITEGKEGMELLTVSARSRVDIARLHGLDGRLIKAWHELTIKGKMTWKLGRAGTYARDYQGSVALSEVRPGSPAPCCQHWLKLWGP